MAVSVYEMVTNRIIEKLEAGVVPWKTPWSEAHAAHNWHTGRKYSGINRMLLEPGEYATFLQIQKAGGKVKKGEKSNHVVFWSMRGFAEVSDDGSVETKTVPLLKHFNVFEINRQCEGLESKIVETKKADHEPIFAAQQIVENYKAMPEVRFSPGRAYYDIREDLISLPKLGDFIIPESFYGAFYHEMIHSTGHINRLKRPGFEDRVGFSTALYSKEELIAEIGACMLCGAAGIENSTIDQSASYIKSWISRLRGDSRLIVQASGAAQKAADYIRGIEKSRD